MSRENAERPTVEGAERGENFISWEQIAPLLTPGMTYRDLCHAVLQRMGLPVNGYALQGRAGRLGRSYAENMQINLRNGLWIVTTEQRALALAAGTHRDAMGEVIA